LMEQQPDNEFDLAQNLRARQIIKIATMCLKRCGMLNNLRSSQPSRRELDCFGIGEFI
jgi:hypothetical protein